MDPKIELQIQNAKIKAEQFSKALEASRQYEASAMKTLENERNKWSQAYEEKTVIIEQLERELEATVDALHHERSSQVTSNINYGEVPVRPGSKPALQDFSAFSTGASTVVNSNSLDGADQQILRCRIDALSLQVQQQAMRIDELTAENEAFKRLPSLKMGTTNQQTQHDYKTAALETQLCSMRLERDYLLKELQLISGTVAGVNIDVKNGAVFPVRDELPPLAMSVACESSTLDASAGIANCVANVISENGSAPTKTPKSENGDHVRFFYNDEESNAHNEADSSDVRRQYRSIIDEDQDDDGDDKSHNAMLDNTQRLAQLQDGRNLVSSYRLAKENVAALASHVNNRSQVSETNINRFTSGYDHSMTGSELNVETQPLNTLTVSETNSPPWTRFSSNPNGTSTYDPSATSYDPGLPVKKTAKKIKKVKKKSTIRNSTELPGELGGTLIDDDGNLLRLSSQISNRLLKDINEQMEQLNKLKKGIIHSKPLHSLQSAANEQKLQQQYQRTTRARSSSSGRLSMDSSDQAHIREKSFFSKERNAAVTTKQRPASAPPASSRAMNVVSDNVNKSHANSRLSRGTIQEQSKTLLNQSRLSTNSSLSAVVSSVPRQDRHSLQNARHQMTAQIVKSGTMTKPVKSPSTDGIATVFSLTSTRKPQGSIHQQLNQANQQVLNRLRQNPRIVRPYNPTDAAADRSLLLRQQLQQVPPVLHTVLHPSLQRTQNTILNHSSSLRSPSPVTKPNALSTIPSNPPTKPISASTGSTTASRPTTNAKSKKSAKRSSTSSLDLSTDNFGMNTSVVNSVDSRNPTSQQGPLLHHLAADNSLGQNSLDEYILRHDLTSYRPSNVIPTTGSNSYGTLNHHYEFSSHPHLDPTSSILSASQLLEFSGLERLNNALDLSANANLSAITGTTSVRSVPTTANNVSQQSSIALHDSSRPKTSRGKLSFQL